MKRPISTYFKALLIVFAKSQNRTSAVRKSILMSASIFVVITAKASEYGYARDTEGWGFSLIGFALTMVGGIFFLIYMNYLEKKEKRKDSNK